MLNITQHYCSLENDHHVMVPCVKITVRIYQACVGFKYIPCVMLYVTQRDHYLDLVKSRERSWHYGTLCENFR